MNKPHKWAKEIKAWADGAEIQMTINDEWVDCTPSWDDSYAGKYRIKPQPKEQQYLYVFYSKQTGEHHLRSHQVHGSYENYVGKIKLEDEDA
jgi:hypothetical protein